MDTHPHNHNPRTGQAMIELMLGVILIMLLLTGAMQYIQVASAHAAIDGGIRGKVGRYAMELMYQEDTPASIQTWDPGPDGQRFTADDTPILKPPTTLTTIAGGCATNATDWNEFGQLSHPSSMETIHTATVVPQTALGFIGIRWTTIVPVSQAAQQLYYTNPNATVQEDCWMPIMNTLY